MHTAVCVCRQHPSTSCGTLSRWCVFAGSIHPVTRAIHTSATHRLRQVRLQEASQKTKPAQIHFPEATAICLIIGHNVTINHNRIAIYFRYTAIERQSERPPKISRIVSIFRQRNRKLKTASESTEPFNKSLKTVIEMNQANYRPTDSCINTLTSST